MAVMMMIVLVVNLRAFLSALSENLFGKSLQTLIIL